MACSQSPQGQADSVATASVRDGHARFQVLSATLIRLEYADDDVFEDGRTQVVVNRRFPATAFSSAVEDGARVIRTGALTLRYRQGSGPFTAQNLSVELTVAGAIARAQPDWQPDSNPQNLGGWRRSLDDDQDAQPLHNGLLSRAGWYLLNDTQTVLDSADPPGFKPRPGHSGSYQDGYFFGYGHDYARGLAELRTLTGAAPLLPRKAFGVWFSRYWAYSAMELQDLVAGFRSHAVPIDTLSIDTDWKLEHNALGCVFFGAVAGARPGDPCSWNGWDWNRDLFPDPKGFLDWAHGQGLAVTANVHPSIDSDDPQFAAVQASVDGALVADSNCFLNQADPSGQCFVFDWTQPRQLQAYFALHAPIEDDGVDFWWLDWCCDGSGAAAPGLTADAFINARYAQRNAARGQRWPAFSRIGASFQEGQAAAADNGAGAFAEHRSTMHFTGDTCATWAMLGFEAQFTAAEGSIGLPYVTHDIGSFLGEPTLGQCTAYTSLPNHHLPDDLYVRWVQFGAFQPLERLHSQHGERLPWEYGGAAEQAASEALRLRERLVPYLYSIARQSHDTGLPMARALYLQWPELDDAYANPSEYTLGADLLVAAVTAAGDPASVALWIPPGEWTDFYTGETLTGPSSLTRSVPLNRFPVFVRAGAILPTQPDLPTSTAGPADGLTLNIWPGSGRFDLYEDEGQGFAYLGHAFSFTALSSAHSSLGCDTLTVGAARGSFPGALSARHWIARWMGVNPPAYVGVDGRSATGWSYDAPTRTLTLDIPAHSTAAALHAVAGPAACAGSA